MIPMTHSLPVSFPPFPFPFVTFPLSCWVAEDRYSLCKVVWVATGADMPLPCHVWVLVRDHSDGFGADGTKDD